MKQEQRLVAEVYRFLAPFVDTTECIYVSLDGQAAQRGVQKGLFDHPTIPDLWFTFIRAQSPTLIEVKTIRKGKMLIMQSQLQAWRSNGTNQQRPGSWIAVNTEFNQFFFWTHEAFLPLLDAMPTTGRKPVPLSLPVDRKEFSQASELALHIIRNC